MDRGLGILQAGSPHGLGQLVHPLANIRVLDLVVRTHELQGLTLDHEIGRVPRQLLGLAAPFGGRRDGRNFGRHALEEVIDRHVQHLGQSKKPA